MAAAAFEADLVVTIIRILNSPYNMSHFLFLLQSILFQEKTRCWLMAIRLLALTMLQQNAH